MPIKAIGKKLNENFLNKNKEEKLKLYFSYVLSTSELYNKILMDCFEIKLNQVLQFGLPRNDLLIKKNSNEMPKQFIWMPTYSNNVSSELYFDFLKKDQLQILNDILKKNDRYLTIKIHPLEYKIPKVKFSNIEILDNYFFIERSIELYDYINKFDALITDFFFNSN